MICRNKKEAMEEEDQKSVPALPERTGHHTHNKNKHKSSNILALQQVGSVKGFTDTASVLSDTSNSYSRYTGKVSSVGSLEYLLNNALVAMIGVGEYDGMPNLDGVVKDYENVIDTFCRYWKYNVLFRLSNDKYIYSDDIDQIKLDENKKYKLKWNGDEISQFIEETRKHIVQEKHNGLIFVISSHGDREKVMYDSECEEYELDALFAMYQPNARLLIESYTETEQESNYLSQIPKIFALDMCRGDMSAKPIETDKKNQQAQSHTVKAIQARSGQGKAEMKTGDEDSINKNGSKEEDKQTQEKSEEKEEKASILKIENEKSEKFTFKGVDKDTAARLATNTSNFLKIYATPDGYSVADGAAKGGLFLRNFCKVLKDRDFVSKHYLNDIVLKIREYTKREATIVSNLFEFTQIVETEGTLAKNVKILSKMSNFSLMGQNWFGVMSDYDGNINFNYNALANDSRKLLITNLSRREKIGVLIEYEDSSEDREDMLNALSSDNSMDNGLFTKHNFVMIEPNSNKHEFSKPYSDSLFITIFIIGDKKNDERKEDDVINREIFDRHESKEDFLYFEKNSLMRLVDFRFKCGTNSKHYLVQTRVIGNTMNKRNKCNKCGVIAMNECFFDYLFVCRKCKYHLCQNCCHKKVLRRQKKSKKHTNSTKKHTNSKKNKSVNGLATTSDTTKTKKLSVIEYGSFAPGDRILYQGPPRQESFAGVDELTNYLATMQTTNIAELATNSASNVAHYAAPNSIPIIRSKNTTHVDVDAAINLATTGAKTSRISQSSTNDTTTEALSVLARLDEYNKSLNSHDNTIDVSSTRKKLIQKQKKLKRKKKKEQRQRAREETVRQESFAGIDELTNYLAAMQTTNSQSQSKSESGLQSGKKNIWNGVLDYNSVKYTGSCDYLFFNCFVFQFE